MSDEVELLAIAAHRDDVELTCGGTLAKAVQQGHRVGIVDLTQGETGTRGDAATRAAEAMRAATALGVHVRLNAGLPDAHLHNDEASRAAVIELIRRTRPRVVILPYAAGGTPTIASPPSWGATRATWRASPSTAARAPHTGRSRSCTPWRTARTR